MSDGLDWLPFGKCGEVNEKLNKIWVNISKFQRYKPITDTEKCEWKKNQSDFFVVLQKFKLLFQMC